MLMTFVRNLLSDPAGRTGVVILALFGAASLVAPLLAALLPGQGAVTPLAPPSSGHPLGTNDIGEDILTHLLLGCRHSLIVGLATGFFSVILSLAAGIGSALRPRVLDKILMRLADALIALPSLLFFILIAAYVRPSTWTLILLFSLFSWQYGARLIRNQTLVLLSQGHIVASRSFGGSLGYIARRHLIPELFPILLVGFVMRTRFAILAEAGLTFIGIGDPLLPSLGKTISTCLGFLFLPVWVWWLLPAGLALSALVTGLTLLGFSLEKRFLGRVDHA